MMGEIRSKEVNRSVGKFNQIDRNKLKNSFRLNNYTELNVERNNLEKRKPGSRIVLSSSFSFRNEKIRWKKSAIFKRKPRMSEKDVGGEAQSSLEPAYNRFRERSRAFNSREFESLGRKRYFQVMNTILFQSGFLFLAII